MRSATDPSHLALAAQMGRVFVTKDKDFPRLNALGVRHVGIVFCRETTPIGRLVTRLVALTHDSDAEVIAGRVQYVK